MWNFNIDTCHPELSSLFHNEDNLGKALARLTNEEQAYSVASGQSADSLVGHLNIVFLPF